ncbi:MAG: hypothetical protein ABI882_03705 [Acidobacteriota bacterium]
MRSLLGILGGLLVLISGYPSRAVPRQQIAAQQVPPPGQRADRIGVYNWNVDDRAFPGGDVDRLNWGADHVAATGTRTIRVFIGPRDIYRLNLHGTQSAVELAELAATPAYDRLFRDPRFSTYLLTTSTYSSVDNSWADGFNAAEYSLERAEIRRFGEYLLKNPLLTGRTFILLNWEGDNEMAGLTGKETTWQSYRDRTEARADGVRDARAAAPGSSAKLYSGLEFNRVRAAAPCGEPVEDPVHQDPFANRCVIDFVAPRVSVDYYSYSAWQTTGPADLNPVPGLAAALKADVRLAVALVRTRRPEVTEANFIIGEFGFERSFYGECRAAMLLREVFSALEGQDALGISYAIYWQIIDNQILYGVLDQRFGLFRTGASGIAATRLGVAFRASLDGSPEPVLPSCSSIVRPPVASGVVDAATLEPRFRLNPDSVLAITSDAPFSAAGNTVRFIQPALDVAITGASGGSFSESPDRITAGLPAARHPGSAWVFVTNADGVDSNGQELSLECANCPQIDPLCGAVDGDFRISTLKPGGKITLSGSFPSPGNTVVIEQQIGGGVAKRTTIERDANWSESSVEITATLPSTLLSNQDAGVYVVDVAGRYSNQHPIFLAPGCANCGPSLRHCDPISSVAGDGYYPGKKISVRGRFANLGNRVVIEQWDETGILVRRELNASSSGWSETEGAIDVRLPSPLRPGRAGVYVVDTSGRESSAQAIEIGTATLAVASAASFRSSSSTPGGIMAAFGNSLAVGIQSAASLPLPTILDGTRVTIRDQTGVDHAAALFFVSPQQVNFEIPDNVAPGPAMVTVESGDGTISSLTLTIISVAPGIFSANFDGEGPASGFALHAIGNDRIYESTAMFDAMTGRYITAPSKFGPPPEELYLVLFGTGFRRRTDLTAVTVTLGNVAGDVAYAGTHEVFVGLDQINVRLPRILEGRGEVEVVVRVDGLTANTVRIRFQ